MTTLQSTLGEKLEVAFTELVGAFPDEWRGEHESTAFVGPGGSHALMIEDTGTTVRVSQRKLGADGWLHDRRAWVLGFKYDGRVGMVEDDRRVPASAASAGQLINLIWAYKRHAVEDAVTVRRVKR
jgi:hypothetical protein